MILTYNVRILKTGIAQNERAAVLPSSPPSKSSRKSAVEEEELQTTTPRAVAFATATTIVIVSLWRSSILPNLFGAAFVRGYIHQWMNRSIVGRFKNKVFLFKLALENMPFELVKLIHRKIVRRFRNNVFVQVGIRKHAI